MLPITTTLSQQKFIIWGFDGVIKDSVEVKSDAYEQLFESFGSKVAKKIRSHHESNGGMSRYEKLPIYLSWAGQTHSQKLIDVFSNKFSNLVKQKVIEAALVNQVPFVLRRTSLNLDLQESLICPMIKDFCNG